MIFNVVLERRAQEGLGLAIKRGCSGEWANCGALVVDILPSGPGYGKLRPGDIIMSVNGVSLEGKSHPEMLDLLRRAEGIVTLLVFRREDVEVHGEAQRAPVTATSTSYQSLFLPDGLSIGSQQRKASPSPCEIITNGTKRTHSMPGFASPQVTPSHAVSLPQLTARSEDHLATLTRDRRQASFLKVNLAKQNPQDGLGVELSGQLVVTSVTPGGKAHYAGIRVGDRVVNLMRREQSNVTLLRVEHEGEEESAHLPPEAAQLFVQDNPPQCGHPCCKLRVGRLDCYPYPRPVIIYGPLAEKAMHLLVEEVSTLDNSDGEPRFEVPPISGAPPSSNAWAAHLCSQSPGVIRLSAIQMLMERGKHAVLYLRPSSIEDLLYSGIVPIVLLVTASSAQQIREALELYRPRCQRGAREMSRRLWSEVASLLQAISHLLTDTVPLFSSPLQVHFDEMEWMHNLISIIRHHQSQPVWVAEDSIAFCKANENALTPVASTIEPPKAATEESSSEKSDPDTREEFRFENNEGYQGDCSSVGRSFEEWGVLNRLELMEDEIEARFPNGTSSKGKNELRRVRIQSPRPDSRSTQTESPRVQETSINTTPQRGSDEDEEERRKVVGPLSVRRHRPLSSSNMPCGLISEPQRFVAEASGEFIPAEGGNLQLPQHGVGLFIPPSAIPDDGDGEKQEIYLRVYEGEHQNAEYDKKTMTKSHIVSPLVMCGPRGLRFQKSVTLTMPRFHTHYGNGGGDKEDSVGDVDIGGRCEVKDEGNEAKTEEGMQSSLPPSSWSLRVMHAATQSDCATSASEGETRQHALRQWHVVPSSVTAATASRPRVLGTSATTTMEKIQGTVSTPSRLQSGTESDSSGAAVTYQIADSFISLLIDHF